MDSLASQGFPDVTKFKRAVRPKPAVLQLVPEPRGHVLMRVGESYACSRCGGRGKSRASICLIPCRGLPRPA
eukprot:3384003-Pyramimonas_sp.AAC.1